MRSRPTSPHRTMNQAEWVHAVPRELGAAAAEAVAVRVAAAGVTAVKRGAAPRQGSGVGQRRCGGRGAGIIRKGNTGWRSGPIKTVRSKPGAELRATA